MSSFSSLFKNHSIGITIGAGALAFVSLYSLKHFTTTKRKKITRIIDTIEVFKNTNVHIKDPDLVEEKISLLIKGGAAKLQVISDFDHTISRMPLKEGACSTTYGVLESCLSDDNKYQTQVLYDYYYPIEIDPHLSIEEKLPYMTEWYIKSHNLMMNYGIKKGEIKDIVNAANLILRSGCTTLFHELHSHDIPLLIFSAGIGDILKEILKQQGLLLPNIKIIANFIQFNEEEKVNGYKNEIIHTFNKNTTSIKHSDYFEHLKERSNVILLGDAIGDIDMAAGVKDANCVLKIGFLNKRVEERLPKFMEAYDIVLADDQTMDFVNGILQNIL